MKVKDLLKKIEKNENGKFYRVYIVSETKKTCKFRTIHNGVSCYTVFIIRNHCKDERLEMDKTVKNTETDKDEMICLSLNGAQSKSYFNSYYITIDKLTKNNKGRSYRIRTEYEPIPKGAKFEL